MRMRSEKRHTRGRRRGESIIDRASPIRDRYNGELAFKPESSMYFVPRTVNILFTHLVLVVSSPLSLVNFSAVCEGGEEQSVLQALPGQVQAQAGRKDGLLCPQASCNPGQEQVQYAKEPNHRSLL